MFTFLFTIRPQPLSTRLRSIRRLKLEMRLQPRLRVGCSIRNPPAKIIAELSLFGIGGISDVNGDFLTEVLGDFFQRQARGFGEEEVDHCRLCTVRLTQIRYVSVDLDVAWPLASCVLSFDDDCDLPGMKKADQRMITR